MALNDAGDRLSAEDAWIMALLSEKTLKDLYELAAHKDDAVVNALPTDAEKAAFWEGRKALLRACGELFMLPSCSIKIEKLVAEALCWQAGEGAKWRDNGWENQEITRKYHQLAQRFLEEKLGKRVTEVAKLLREKYGAAFWR